MKFTDIMHRLLILFLLSCVVSSASIAQSTNNSPYSYYGLGEIGGLDHASLGAIGNAYLCAFDSTVLNFYNPSSYNTLATGVPLVSIGVSSRLSTYSQGSISEFSNVAGLHHFALAFPVHKHVGLAFGIKPFSRKGYSFTTKEKIGSDSLEYTYEGKGSANEAFVGVSTDILQFPTFRWAVGINAGYIFGRTSNYRTASVIGATNGGYEERSIQANSFHYSLGTYLDYRINGVHNLRFGGTYEPIQYLNTDYKNTVFYASNVNANPYGFDTLTATTSTGRFTLAPKIGLGLSYTINFGAESTQSKHKNQLTTHLNYSMTDWSKYNDPYSSSNTSTLSTTSLNFGVQYIPETDLKNLQNSKFYQRLRYRAGAYSYTLPYDVNGEQLKDFGTTFGIGLPVTIGNAISSLDLGLSYGSRGVQDETVLKESYYGINIGVTISPDRADRWFRKRKLN